MSAGGSISTNDYQVSFAIGAYHNNVIEADSYLSNESVLVSFAQVITGVNVLPTLSSISIYPNPVDNEFSVKFDQAGIAGLDYRIIDINGATLLKGSLDSPFDKIDVTTIPSGMYLLQVNESGGGFSTLRFIKK